MKPPKRPRDSMPSAGAMRFRSRGLRFPALAAVLAAGLLAGCEMSAGRGGGTETESRVVAGRAVDADGSPAMRARVTLRPSDYLPDLISTEEVSKRVKDTVTDAQGRFNLGGLPAGDYRVEIAGAEARGSIHDFSLTFDEEGLQLATDTVKPRGSIAGSFAPDSEVQLTRFVQVFGVERLVKADPSGGFILYNLPEGVYDIRCSSLQPFRRDAVLRGVTVGSGKQTAIPPVRLEKEAKLGFSVDAQGLRIEGLDSTNPVILDNERWDNGVDNEYIWAKASLGSLDLRGNVVTNDFRSGQLTIAAQLEAGREERRLAGLAGLTRIPDLSAGAATRLRLPASGRVEDIMPAPSAGSDLIVAEARKATPEKPLLVVAGGPLTTVAQAYLTDPSIATRMVVAGIFTYSLQSDDTLANYLVAKRCRYMQWGRTYSWGGNPDTARIKEIPLSRMGERVRNYLSGATVKIAFGDMAPVAFLFRRGLWKNAQMVKVSAALEVQPASDITFDFLDIPLNANDWPQYNEEFYSTLGTPALYAPKPVPGLIEAEAYVGRAGVSAIPFDPGAGSAGVAFPAGSWTEYRVSAAAAGRFAVRVRYRSEAGGRMSIGLPNQPPLAESALPPSAAWTEAPLDSVALEAGATVLRVSSTSGKIDLIGFELR
ncbi:MAG TPA: carboxypeptidase regulatory-like domain-containing protein [Fibrobacteria bacterium]|nr:carboxypeptidase regulatory-like domain-containing protein [Fibrobacteria bacterium]